MRYGTLLACGVFLERFSGLRFRDPTYLPKVPMLSIRRFKGLARRGRRQVRKGAPGWGPLPHSSYIPPPDLRGAPHTSSL